MRNTVVILLACTLLAIATGCQEAVVIEQLVEQAAAAKEQQTQKKKEDKTIKNGTVVRENAASNTTSEVHFKDGLKDGLAKQYYADGQVWKESMYKGGHLEGTARVYDREGNLTREVEYQAGKKHGRYTAYFKSGKPKLEIEYRQDRPLPGHIEHGYQGEVKENPKIIVTEEDRLAKEGLYLLHLQLSVPKKDVQFLAMEDPALYQSEESIRRYLTYQEDGEGVLSIEVPRGYIFDNTIYFFAQYDLERGVQVVTEKAFKLKVENK